MSLEQKQWDYLADEWNYSKYWIHCFFQWPSGYDPNTSGWVEKLELSMWKGIEAHFGTVLDGNISIKRD